MRRALLLLPILALLPAAGLGQPAPGLAETILTLGETAEVARAPDELVATLRAEARAGTAAAAQAQVNQAMAAAVARARSVERVQVATGGYWTGRTDEGRAWQATQTLTLRGPDAAALLELTGALQQAGLASTGLTYRLTREAERAAREEASRLALAALQRRAQAVAEQLGLQLIGLREVRIDAEASAAPRAALAMRAGAASPVAVAEEIIVTARIEAVAVLRPR